MNYKLNDIIIAKDNFTIQYDWYKINYGSGIIKKGTKFKIIKLPTFDKKLYKLEKINETNIKYIPELLYVRKSFLKQHFESINGD